MSKSNNNRLRAENRRLVAKVAELHHHIDVLVSCCRCAYCSEVMLNDRDELLAHSKVCPEHPCRPLEAELQRLRSALESSPI